MATAGEGAADPLLVNPESSGQLTVADLLLDVAELRPLLSASLKAADPTDAFLLAAGLNQVLEDHLHRDPYSLRKVELAFAGWGRAGRAAAAVPRVARAGALWARSLGNAERRLQAGQRELAEIVDLLAAAVLGSAMDWPALERRWRALDVRIASARLAAEVIRLPSCFRDLDQRPEDVDCLAGLVVGSLPAEQPIAVVGLRTSGSYLGPLLAAGLRRRGRRVTSLTLRPGTAVLANEISLLGKMARAGARAVVVDDPPSSGRALRRGIAALEAAGFSRQAITVAVATLDAERPAGLDGVDHVVLEYERWAVHRALDEQAVRRSLTKLLLGRELQFGGGPGHVIALLDVRLTNGGPRRPSSHGWLPRRHAEAAYEVKALTPFGARRLQVHARGCGLGYLGRHALAIAGALGDRVPTHFGIADGLLFRESVEGMPAYAPIDCIGAENLARVTAGYVGDRAAALPAPRDKSLGLSGRNPVWQRAADMLGEPFGRLRPLARWPLHRLAKRLLAAPRPAVIDADVDPECWYVKPGADGSPRTVKVRADAGAYSNEDLACYDPVFDLASAEVGIRLELGQPSSVVTSVLRAEVAEATDERWLLYRLTRLAIARLKIEEEWSAKRSLSESDVARLVYIDTAREQAHAEYLAAALRPISTGSSEVCAIDVDGVLESGHAGYSTTTPLGLLSLQALAAHGYAPVLASGRSLDDVRWRCASYGLRAAVAEYGCVAYVSEPERVVELIDGRQREAMLELSRRMAAAGIWTDRSFRCAVRAFRLDEAARRRALDPAVTSALLAGLEHEVTVVAGWSQTDFVPSAVDKRSGLEALFRLAGWRFQLPHPLALAVGDSASDLGMLRMARLGVAPGNAAEQLTGPGIARVRSSHQRGLAGAVARLIGHRPGTCHRCAPRPLSREARLLLRVFGSRDLPALARPWELLRLLAETYP